MHQKHEHIRLSVGRDPVAQLIGHTVDRGNDRSDVECRDTRRAHERRQLLSDCADEANRYVAKLTDLVLLVSGHLRALFVDVRAQIRPVGRRDDPVVEVIRSLIEFVVAQRGGVEPDRVESLDRRGVLLDEGGES